MGFLEEAKKYIRLHEGLRLKPYECPTGHLTIGYGRNIQQNGITVEEAEILLENDIQRVVSELQKWISVFDELSETRKAVLIDMVFNLGFSRFFQFRKMIQALREKNFDQAAEEMLDSKWHKQVGNRAKFLAAKMKEG